MIDRHSAPSVAPEQVLNIERQRRRTFTWLVILTISAVLSLVLGIAIGSVYIPPGDVVGILGHRLFGLAQGSWSESTEAIVWDVRLPRVLLALCVGAGLAVCGMALQAMVRNMLADPYLLGINSGASSGPRQPSCSVSEPVWGSTLCKGALFLAHWPHPCWSTVSPVAADASPRSGYCYRG